MTLFGWELWRYKIKEYNSMIKWYYILGQLYVGNFRIRYNYMPCLKFVWPFNRNDGLMLESYLMTFCGNEKSQSLVLSNYKFATDEIFILRMMSWFLQCQQLNEIINIKGYLLCKITRSRGQFRWIYVTNENYIDTRRYRKQNKRFVFSCT